MAKGLNVAVVDYDAGNTLSVTRALEKVGAGVELTPDPERVLAADAVVLPGVGAFASRCRWSSRDPRNRPVWRGSV